MISLLGYASSDALALAQDAPERVYDFAVKNDVPLEQMELSPRTKNVLRLNLVRSLSQLLPLDDAALASFGLMNEACDSEIRMLVADYLDDKAVLIREASEPDRADPVTELLIDDASRKQVVEALRAAGLVASLEELSLSVRAYNCMKRMKKDDICGLIELYPDGFYSIRNVGNKTVAELVAVVEKTVRQHMDLIRAYMAGEDISPYMLKQPQSEEETLSGSAREEAKELLSEAEIQALLCTPTARASLEAFIAEHDIPVSVMGLSNRSFNATKRVGIDSLSALLPLYPDGFGKIKNIGSKSIQELKAAVETYANQSRTAYLAESTRSDAAHNGDEAAEYPEELLRFDVLSCFNGLGFKGLHYPEIRERCPQNVDEAQLKKVIGKLLRENELEYVDFRCFRKYPSILRAVETTDKLKERDKEVFFRRLAGETLEAVGDDYNVSRQRALQIETKCRNFVSALAGRPAEQGLFDEQYYAYFYETYDVPEEFWADYSGVPVQVRRLLAYLYKGGETPLQAALADPELDVPLKIRISDYLNRDLICLDGKMVKRSRAALENHVIRTRCQEATSFEDFVALYNNALSANHIDFDPDLYITDEVRQTRYNNVEGSRFCLWKYGKKFRYYDIDAGDYEELYEVLALEDYENTEVTTLKFMEEYPELMRKYDIRDEYELHNLIRKTVDKSLYHDLDLRRQPTLGFGTFDREAAFREILSVLSPIPADELEAYLHSEFGYAMNTLKMTYLTPFAKYLNGGIYDIAALRMPPERKAALKATLTEDLYPIKRIMAIYKHLFPEAPEGELHAGELRAMGFKIYSEYALKNYNSLEEYYTRLLTDQDSCTIRDKLRRYSATQTFYSVYKRLKRQYDIFLYEPDRLITFRRLERFGVTKEEIRGFADAAYEAVEDEAFFTMHSLRAQGFTTSLDRLGFDDFFLGEILAEDSRFAWQRVFGTVVLRRTEDEASFGMRDFLFALLSDYESIDMDDFEDLLREEYGITEPNPYKIIELVRESDEGFYFDNIMRTIYRSKSNYLAEFDE